MEEMNTMAEAATIETAANIENNETVEVAQEPEDGNKVRRGAS